MCQCVVGRLRVVPDWRFMRGDVVFLLLLNLKTYEKADTELDIRKCRHAACWDNDQLVCINTGAFPTVAGVVKLHILLSQPCHLPSYVTCRPLHRPV